MAKEPKLPQPFTDVLTELERGRLASELTEAYHNMVAAVMDTRKPGAIKLKLTFSPTGKGTIAIDSDFDAKLPEHDRPQTMFFVGPGFSLSRNDPSQPDLPLNRAETPDDQPVSRVVPINGAK